MLALMCAGSFSAAFAAPAPPEQIVSSSGSLPVTGRIVIRSGLSWLEENEPLFTAVERSLAAALAERGLTVVDAPPSRLAPFPVGADAIRRMAVPKNPGRPPRIMSVAEASMRMRAMQLAREGKLPRAVLGGNGGEKAGALPSGPTTGELIRFALSQEKGMPELRGRITIPGRMPDEVRFSDPRVADYAMLVRLAMLWPGSGIPDEPRTLNRSSGLAVGWHLLELACYDLSPAGKGNDPERIWSAYAQRVAFGAYLRGTLPGMARDAVLSSSR